MEPTSKLVSSSAAQDHLSEAAAQAAGLALLNAVSAQQQAYSLGNATVTMTVQRILAGQGPSDGAANAEDTAEATAAKLRTPHPSAPSTPDAVASDANYAMIAQAWAIAAQDAAAYLRNVEIIATAAMGVALAAITGGSSGGDPNQALQAAQSMVANAEKNLEQVCTQAATSLKEFPRTS